MRQACNFSFQHHHLIKNIGQENKVNHHQCCLDLQTDSPNCEEKCEEKNCLVFPYWGLLKVFFCTFKDVGVSVGLRSFV